MKIVIDNSMCRPKAIYYAYCMFEKSCPFYKNYRIYCMSKKY